MAKKKTAAPAVISAPAATQDVVNITEQADHYSGSVATTLHADGVTYRVAYQGEVLSADPDTASYSINLRTVHRDGAGLDFEKLPRRTYWQLQLQAELDFFNRILPRNTFGGGASVTSAELATIVEGFLRERFPDADRRQMPVNVISMVEDFEHGGSCREIAIPRPHELEAKGGAK